MLHTKADTWSDTTSHHKVENFGDKQNSKFKKWLAKKKSNIGTRDFWARRFPLIDWLTGYNTSFFVSDLIAGLTVGLTVIPQGMACAVVAGLPPQYGLYSAFIPCFVYMFLGTSKDITIGPTAISAMLVKPYADQFGPDVVVLICFVCGIFITILGVLQLGFLVDLISMPVLAGFMSAGAISIASSQIAPLLGVKSSGSSFLEYWRNVIERISETRLWDPILGVICIVFLLLLKDIQKCCAKRGKDARYGFVAHGILRYLALGRNALVVIIATVIVAMLMSAFGESPVRITGPVEEGFPEIRVPNFDLTSDNRTLTLSETANVLSSGLVIPFVLILESIAIAKAFAKGKSLDATQEMLALGLSNIIGSFFQSFPVTGSFTRTAVNNASGVKTPVGGIYTGTLVLLCLAFLTRYLQYIPKATLSAVIICAVVFMVEIHEVTKSLWKSKKLDLIPLYTTFFGCIFIGMDYGIVIGILINMIFILYEAARPRLKVQKIKVLTRKVLLVYPDRSITYLSAEYVKDVITRACSRAKGGMLVVVDGRCIHSIDSTAVKMLKSLLIDLRSRSQPVVFWNWSKTIMSNFIGFDSKGAEFFRHGESLEQMLPEEELEKSVEIELLP